MTLEEPLTDQGPPLSSTIPPAPPSESSVYTTEMSTPQVVVVANESNVKTPPKFSGSGFSLKEDPLQFLKDFREAATWNNWTQDNRLKELFYRCLQGLAKEWFSTIVRCMPAYIAGEIPFESADQEHPSVISLFKEKFVTPVWFARYEDLYDSRCQGEAESASNYILCKTALYHKANAKGTCAKTEKERTRDLRKGLLPHLQRKCFEWEFSPYTAKDHQELNTIAKLQTLLEWLESTEEVTPMVENTPKPLAVVPKPIAVNTVKEPQPSKYEKAILDKLDKMENDMALARDKMKQYDRSLELVSQNARDPPRKSKGYSGTNKTANIRCYNCHRLGHYASNCTDPCRCGIGEEEPLKKENPKPGSVNAVIVEVNAVKEKKSDEEILATRLRNLEKARAMKALYKIQREEEAAAAAAAAAASAAEAPEITKAPQVSSAPAAPKVGPKLHIRTTPLDVEQMLDNITVSVPLKQLLQCSPEVHKQCGRILGYTNKPAAREFTSTLKSKWNPDNMDVDQVSFLKVDTSATEAASVALQAVYAAIDEEILEFLIDGGAMTSLVPFYVVQKLNRVAEIKPSERIVKFGDGALELTMGSIKLTMVLSGEVEITHTFLVMKTCKTPLILGMDFLKLTRCRPDAAQGCLEFTGPDGHVFIIDTCDGDGMLKDPLYMPEGALPEEAESLITPVLLKTNAWNDRLQDVSLNEAQDFDPGETTMLPLKITKEAATWTVNKALQPDPALWAKGLYVVPMVLQGGALMDDVTHSLAILNTSNEPITLERGTRLGQLYNEASVPEEVEWLTSFDHVMDVLMTIYNHASQVSEGPSLFVGPVYKPERIVTNTLTVNTLSSTPPMQFDINKELTTTQQSQLSEVLTRYSSVFATSLKQVGKLKVEPYEIKVKEGAVPVKVPPRMIPHAANEWFKGYIEQLLELGLIEPCTGPWAAAVVLVPSNADDRAPRRRKAKEMKIAPRLKLNANGKPLTVYTMSSVKHDEVKEEVDSTSNYELLTRQWSEGNVDAPVYKVADVAGSKQDVTSESPALEAGKKDPYRVCVNYKPVNKVMVDSGYPIPNINFLFTLLKDAKYFALYDCLKGFWQLPLSESSRDLSGFSCSMGQFRWTRLPMGMKLSPLAWQAQMDAIFFDDLLKTFLCYIDDGLTFSPDFESHLVHVENILAKAQKAGLSLSLSKCKFGYSEVKLLGYIVSRAGLQMDPAKTLRILQWPTPTNIHELNRFIGVVQYYRRFIPHLSEMLSSMNDLRKKNVRYEWTDRHEEQFQALKRALMTDPIMNHPDFQKKFVLLCDASNVAIGGVLAQANEDDPTLLHPVFFGSKALSTTERKISTYEKEFLAIVYFIHFYKQYLMGNHFTVYTDQKSLQYLIKFSEDASAKVVRWQASLMAYDFDIIYKSGKLNVHADAMSRLESELTPEQEASVVIADYYLPLNVVRREPDDGFSAQQGSDKKVKTRLEELATQQLTGSAGMKDEIYKAISDYLTQWKYPSHYTKKQRKALRHTARNYNIDKGTLYKNGTKEEPVKRLVVRQADILKVLKENHDHILAGHQGIGATYQRIKQHYYWPGYYDTVRTYVQSCPTCQNFGVANKKVPMHIVENRATEGAFSKIGIDYIYTPRTAQGHSAALVIIDYLTSWVHAEPVSTQSASSTCLVLFKYICQYGCPNQIIADNGSHFTAVEVQQYMRKTFDIHLNFGPPHRPQRQGKVERANRTLKSILKKYMHDYVSDWDVFLPAALFVMRTMVKIDGAYSPFVLTYGRPPRFSALENEDLMQIDEGTQEEAIMARIEELVKLNRNVIPEATRKMNLYKVKMKAQYDKAAKDKKFKVHDRIMVKDHTVIKDGQTLIPKWLGPFVISKKLANDTYIVQDQHLTLPHAYHADQIKLYKARPKIYLPINIDRSLVSSVNGG